MDTATRSLGFEVFDADNHMYEAREALTKFLSQNNLRGDIVAIAVPGQSGLARFVWDGKSSTGTLQEAGSYSFSVTATAGGKAVTTTSYGLGSVLSVAMNDSDIEAEVSGLGSLTLDKIRQVY